MTWLRFFDAYEPMHAMVAEASGATPGLVHILLHRSAIQIAPSVYLQDSSPSKDSAEPRVYWQTHETNDVAMRLYEELAENSGFIVDRKML